MAEERKDEVVYESKTNDAGIVVVMGGDGCMRRGGLSFKITTFCFSFHSMQKHSKRVKLFN